MIQQEIDQILKRPDVEKITSLSRASIYRMIQDGSFPKPIRLGNSRSVGWKLSEIQSWINEQITSSDAA